MRGSPVGQVDCLFKKSGINQIGESKHAAKQAARQELKAAGQAANWQNIGQKVGIYSHRTAKVYREIWVEYLKWARDFEKIKDCENLTSEHVKKYIQYKKDSGLARQTLKQHCAALAKMDSALTLWCNKIRGGRDIEWSQGLKEAREISNALEKTDHHRAYTEPKRLVNALDGKYKLAAKLQLEGGLRIREMALIKREQIKEDHIKIRGKGGKFRDIKLPDETFNQLKNVIENQGAWSLGNKDKYREALKKAAERTGQEYNSSHGLRWNFAQARMGEVQEAGASFEQALGVVSKEMGHNRAEITMHYLR